MMAYVETRYILITPDGCTTFYFAPDAFLAYKLACDRYDAVLLVEFGGMRRSRRHAEKWASDGWTQYAEKPP